MKRVIFHVNMHVWLSESPEHQTEESHNLYYRDHHRQRPLTGGTVCFGGSPCLPVVNTISNSNAIVEVHVWTLPLTSSCTPPHSCWSHGFSSALQEGGSKAGLCSTPPSLGHLGLVTAPGSGPSIVLVLSKPRVLCAAIMKNWISKKGVSGTSMCFRGIQVYLQFLRSQQAIWSAAALCGG